MRGQARGRTNGGRGDDATEEPIHEDLRPLLWQAHVEDEMERVAREHRAAPEVTHFAEEYAERAMRGVGASANEYQHAAERGEVRGAADAPDHLADAGDIAGG